MTRAGRRGHPSSGKNEPAADLLEFLDNLDATERTNILKDAGLDAELLEDMSEEEKQGTVKAIVESNPSILDAYKRRSPEGDDEQDDANDRDEGGAETLEWDRNTVRKGGRGKVSVLSFSKFDSASQHVQNRTCEVVSRQVKAEKDTDTGFLKKESHKSNINKYYSGRGKMISLKSKLKSIQEDEVAESEQTGHFDDSSQEERRHKDNKNYENVQSTKDDICRATNGNMQTCSKSTASNYSKFPLTRNHRRFCESLSLKDQVCKAESEKKVANANEHKSQRDQRRKLLAKNIVNSIKATQASESLKKQPTEKCVSKSINNDKFSGAYDKTKVDAACAMVGNHNTAASAVALQLSPGKKVAVRTTACVKEHVPVQDRSRPRKLAADEREDNDGVDDGDDDDDNGNCDDETQAPDLMMEAEDAPSPDSNSKHREQGDDAQAQHFVPSPTASSNSSDLQEIKREKEAKASHHHEDSGGESAVQLVPDSDEDETQGYDVDDNHVLAANTEVSPTHRLHRSNKAETVPESQPVDLCDEDSKDDKGNSGTRVDPDSPQEKMETIVHVHSSRPSSAASSGTDGEEVLLNRKYPKQAAHGKKMLSSLFLHTPDQIKEPERYTPVIKLMFEMYVRRLRRAQLRMGGKFKEWGKPVSAGSHMEGCLLSKRSRYDLQMAENIGERGGRMLRSRRQRDVDEVLMKRSRGDVKEESDDDDFENKDHLGRRSLRPMFQTNNDELDWDNEEKCTKSYGKELRTVGQEQKRSEMLGTRLASSRKRTLNEMETREMLLRDISDKESSGGENNSEDDWVPPKAKMNVSAATRRNKRNYKKTGESENRQKSPPWLGKRQRQSENVKGNIVDKDLDVEVEEKTRRDGKTCLELPLKQPPGNSRLKLNKRYSWDDDSGDEKLTHNAGRGGKSPAVKETIRGARNNDQGENRQENKHKDYHDEEKGPNKCDIVTIDDDDSSNEKLDVENPGAQVSDAEGVSDDDDLPVSGIPKVTSRAGSHARAVVSSQRATTGISSSQSSESMLDIHGNLYSTQVAHKTKTKLPSKETASENVSLKPPTAFNKDMFPSTSGTKTRGYDKEVSKDKKSANSELPQSLDVTSENVNLPDVGFKTVGGNRARETKAEGRMKRRSSDEDKRPVKDSRVTKETVTVIDSMEIPSEQEEGEEILENMHDSNTESKQGPSSAGDGIKRKLLPNQSCSTQSNRNDADNQVVPQKKRKVEPDIADDEDEEGTLRRKIGMQTRLPITQQGESSRQSSNKKVDIHPKEDDTNLTPGLSHQSHHPDQSHSSNVQQRSNDEQGSKAQNSDIPIGECPICGQTFQLSELVAHASTCGEDEVEEPKRRRNAQKEVALPLLRDHQVNCSRFELEEDPPSKRLTRSHRGVATARKRLRERSPVSEDEDYGPLTVETEGKKT